MAKLTTITKHPDQTPRRALKPEDISFLKELQKRLCTEDHLCTAAPRYYIGIQKEAVHAGYDNADAEMFIDHLERHETFTLQGNSLAPLINYLNDTYMPMRVETAEQGAACQKLAEIRRISIDGSTVCFEMQDETHAYMLEEKLSRYYSGIKQNGSCVTAEDICSMQEAVDLMNDAVGSDGRFESVPARIIETVQLGALALTQEGWNEHVRLDGHNMGPDVHMYCSHADACPELEKLMEILEHADWDSLVQKGIQS